jgi:hypothetical protein
MKSNNEIDMSDIETITSKPKAPRKLPTCKDNNVDRLDGKYLLLSKHSLADIKKVYLPKYKILGSLLREKENKVRVRTEHSVKKDNKLENITDDKPQSKEILVTLTTKQTNVNNYFKSSKARKLVEIEKTLDEKIRPSSKKRKVNKINFNYK